MRKNCKKFLVCCFALMFVATSLIMINFSSYAYADTQKTYYTVYKNSDKKDVLFLKGDDVSAGDRYLSGDNKLYEIVSVDDKDKSAIAKFLQDEELPKYNVTKKNNTKTISQAKAVTKKVGVYHTHNDESYFTPDGIDSVYGKGGIHDVGKAFVNNLTKLGVDVVYREDLHLPHNSGAYTRSQVTASELLNNGVDAIFDLHRDSTKRSEYLTTVDGNKMSSVRMVVGASSANFEENKKFAYSIKSYADTIYPGLIKDIYIGKGNYNQQLSTRAMLFEMGCENIEKDYVIKTTQYLSKVVDVVLYGSESASKQSLEDVSLASNASDSKETKAIAGLVSDSGSVNSNKTLEIVLCVIGVISTILAIVLLVSKKARYKVGRFFSEMFGGLFGKKAKR